MTHEQLPPLTSGTNWQLTGEANERLNRRFNLEWSVRNCITCGGEKTFRWYRPGDRTTPVTYDCNCVNQWKMHRYFLAHGIPVKYQKMGWEDAEHGDPTSLEIVGDYFVDREEHIRTGTGMFLHGAVGTGKTLLASLVLKSFLADGYSGFYSSFYDILEGKSRGWTSEEDREWFEFTIRNCKVLLIDDPGHEAKGTERQIEFGRSLLEDLLRNRVQNDLPTIITSNWMPHKFADMYGEYVGSLIEEGMITRYVGGESYRVKKKARDQQERDDHLRRPITVT